MQPTPPAGDRIRSIRLSSVHLPLAIPVSDAKVLTGVQTPMTEIALLFAEIGTDDGHEGLGFTLTEQARAWTRETHEISAGATYARA